MPSRRAKSEPSSYVVGCNWRCCICSGCTGAGSCSGRAGRWSPRTLPTGLRTEPPSDTPSVPYCASWSRMCISMVRCMSMCAIISCSICARCRTPTAPRPGEDTPVAVAFMPEWRNGSLRAVGAAAGPSPSKAQSLAAPPPLPPPPAPGPGNGAEPRGSDVAASPALVDEASGPLSSCTPRCRSLCTTEPFIRDWWSIACETSRWNRLSTLRDCSMSSAWAWIARFADPIRSFLSALSCRSCVIWSLSAMPSPGAAWSRLVKAPFSRPASPALTSMGSSERPAEVPRCSCLKVRNLCSSACTWSRFTPCSARASITVAGEAQRRPTSKTAAMNSRCRWSGQTNLFRGFESPPSVSFFRFLPAPSMPPRCQASGLRPWALGLGQCLGQESRRRAGVSGAQEGPPVQAAGDQGSPL
mmetsp:Transcript_12412/g.35904  ORF Transcript_12412/g.35904 Transcript_12412/m.35904 type:complete len:414 (+) Transcript_12412:517-1758(+)